MNLDANMFTSFSCSYEIQFWGDKFEVVVNKMSHEWTTCCDFLVEVTNLHINVIQVSDQIVLLVVQMRCILAERGSLRSNEWKPRLMVWNRGSLAGLGSAHWSDSCMEDLYLCNYFRIQFCFLQCSEVMMMMMMVSINCALAKHQILF